MKLEDTFRRLKARREGAHMPHVYYGDPTEAFSIQLINELAVNGADLIEFGIPFSDPTADGPTFQSACERALRQNITPRQCIQAIEQLRKSGLTIPLVVTTYYNIPFIYGIDLFVEAIRKAGAQAIIVPNLPVEEAGILLKAGRQHKIRVILQVAPTTTADRLKRIADSAQGFLYVIGIEGVTGVRDSLATSTLGLITRVRQHTEIPVMAGFGISTRDHSAAVVAAGADGAIAGSAYAKLYEQNLSAPEKTLPGIARLARQIKQGCIDGYRQRITRVPK